MALAFFVEKLFHLNNMDLGKKIVNFLVIIRVVRFVFFVNASIIHEDLNTSCVEQNSNISMKDDLHHTGSAHDDDGGHFTSLEQINVSTPIEKKTGSGKCFLSLVCKKRIHNQSGNRSHSIKHGNKPKSIQKYSTKLSENYTRSLVQNTKLMGPSHVEKEAGCSPYHDEDTYYAQRLGYTGRGVTVAVVDNGVDIYHPDLVNRSNVDLSKSFVDTEEILPTILHNYRGYDNLVSHGTMVAGLIVGQTNNVSCTAGIAQNAKIVVLKVAEIKEVFLHLGLRFNLDLVPSALAHFRNKIDIYSCSFSNTAMFETLSLKTEVVMREGTEHGRHGKGNIFVFSSGNKRRGSRIYDCNGSGYSSSIYTITISSVGSRGTVPKYGIPCSCTMASTFGDTRSSGDEPLMSTSLGNSFGSFRGTSAAAAKATAMIAMALEARPSLTWRGIQQIIVFTSSLSGLERKGEENGVGLFYDPLFGFGLMNATAMVLLVKYWTTLPQMNVTVDFTRKSDQTNNKRHFQYSRKSTQKNCLLYLEHVVVHMNYTHSANIAPVITLCSPQNTCSPLLNGNLRNGDEQKVTENSETTMSWDFMSVQFWGEYPVGRWSLEALSSDGHAFINSASVTFFGSPKIPFSRKLNLKIRRPGRRARCAKYSKEILTRRPINIHETEGSSDVIEDFKCLILVVVGLVSMFGTIFAFRWTQKRKVTSMNSEHDSELKNVLMENHAGPSNTSNQ